MSTNTSSSLDQPSITAATPNSPRLKVIRIATMTKQLLDEVRIHTSAVQAAEDTSTSSDMSTSPNQPDRPHFGPRSPTKCPPDDTAPDEDNAANRLARQTLITAITRRITQRRLTAADAATVLHLTGPRATQLLRANTDAFTLDELVDLLPALDLIIRRPQARRAE
jgi:predicted XRE-type DNA-binding protein